MKLYSAPFSPFARKVRACAVARGIEAQITVIAAVGGSPELEAVNPLGKLPCLVTDDGLALFDSRVICEFLDAVGDVIPMFPEHGPRFRALRFQALGDGIMDAAVLRRTEQLKPQEAGRDSEMAKQARKVEHSLAFLEQDVPADHVDIGTVAVACALGYLDARFGHEDWRQAHPKLAEWFGKMSQRPCMVQTAAS